MKILQTAALAAAFSAPILSSGCSRPDDKPLKDFRSAAPGIQLFDENEDGKLDTCEAEKYVKVVVVNGDNKLSNKEVATKVMEIVHQIRAISPRGGGAPMGPSSYPANVEATLESLKAVSGKYLNAHYNEQDQKIKQKLDRSN
jgi:hypothetical protein